MGLKLLVAPRMTVTIQFIDFLFFAVKRIVGEALKNTMKSDNKFQ